MLRKLEKQRNACLSRINNFRVENLLWIPYNEYRLTAVVNNLNYQDTKDLDSFGLIRLVSSDHSVTAVQIENSPLVKRIPVNLFEYFPRMTILCIDNCDINRISREDLRSMHKLKEIQLKGLNIEELPAGLFDDLNDLEVISFFNNKITMIAKDIFKNIKKLKYVNLAQNPSIDVVFADATVDNLYFVENDLIYKRIFDFRQFNDIVNETFHPKQLTNERFQPNHQPRASTSNDMKVVPQVTLLPANVSSDLKKLLVLDDFKDFVIKIDENEFKVHKLMLAARSPTLAEMIKNNPDAEELLLTDIDVETFKIILSYIYDDKMPENYDENSTKVFAAAGRLNLEPLKLKMGNILCTAVDSTNCFEMLKITCKHNHDELKKKSFDEFKSLFPEKTIKDEWIVDLDKLKKIYDGKKAYDDKLKQAQDEFEKLLCQ